MAAAALVWPAGAEPASAQTGSAQPALRPVSPAAPQLTADVATDRSTTSAAETPTALLSTTSARIEDRVVPERPAPVGLRIEALEISAPVAPAGALPNNEMEVPTGIDEVAWYRYGPAPGEPGSAVLAAHVDLAGHGPGIFYELHSLRRGDRITVDYDGSAWAFEVVDGATYHKSELDTERIFARTGPPKLTLVTCGGGFNPSLRRYDSNVVVYAIPVATDGRGTS